MNALVLAIKRRPDQAERRHVSARLSASGPFGEIESIMLRFPEKRVFDQEEELEKYKRGETQFDQHESVNYPAFDILHEARSLVFGLMALVQGERLGRVMINKIAPGGRIYPHADTPEHTDYYTRFHVVLQSAPVVYSVLMTSRWTCAQVMFSGLTTNWKHGR